MTEKDASYPVEEGQYQEACYQVISQIGRDELRNSSLVAENPTWTEEDPRIARDFFMRAAPYANEMLFPDYWEHIVLSSLVAKEITTQAGLDEGEQYELETLALFHDVGRLVAPNRYYRNDLIADALESKFGVQPSVMEKFVPLDRILGMSDPRVRSISDLTVPQWVLHVADNMGKFSQEDDGIMTINELLSLSSSNRYIGEWPSERKALEMLRKDGLEEEANKILVNEVNALEGAYGVDFERLRENVWREYKSDENQAWVEEANFNKVY